MKRIFMLLGSVFITAVVTVGTTHPASALFEDFKKEACKGITLKEDDPATPGVDESACAADSSTPLNKLLTTAINIFSLVVGVVAVIGVIFGGLKYVTSMGDPAKSAAARNTIIYAVVGLAVVALAQAIVRFVLKRTAT